MKRANSSLRRLLGLIRLVPSLFVFTVMNLVGNQSVTGDGACAVSLTTYSKRTRWVFLSVESIARGAVRPSRLILWIDDEAILNDLPRTLLRLQRRGLEIRRTKNYGPHKKFYSFVESEENFYLPLVTADDDIIYPRFWLRELLQSYLEYPTSVSCFRAHRVSISGSVIEPYRQWEPCLDDLPSFSSFSTGASGALYPPGLLRILKARGTDFLVVSPHADDVWLHASAVGSGFPTRQVHKSPIEFPVIPGTQGLALSRNNVLMDGNDRQIAATYREEDIERMSG